MLRRIIEAIFGSCTPGDKQVLLAVLLLLGIAAVVAVLVWRLL